MNEVTVFAKITAKKECVSQVLAELKNLVALVQKEPGCVAYKAHQNLRQPELFHFYEVWASQESLDRHAKAPALTDFQRKAADWVEGLDVIASKEV
ncbi:MAG: antibiotic biosynthesis monooxygenase [Verrucomicrobiales bacterium]|jgi:quinol monooxygenase YgiN|nr:antibiotic biosynthesis monooxygenase [Verrucomicrobiales bacterium]